MVYAKFTTSEGNFKARLYDAETPSTVANFTGLADEPLRTGVDDAFGRNLRRLAEVKARYDPGNFFRLNNNIAPATTT